MTKLGLILLALTFATTALARVKVIYGTDDRLDLYQVQNPLHKQLALSTAGMIHNSAFSEGQERGLFDIRYAQTLEAAMNVCRHEKFSQQYLAPSCSGFLVADDIIVTAGHCYIGFDNPQSVCRDYKWVFGYEMKSSTHNPTMDIKKTDIYGCKEIIKAQLDNNHDFAIIKLDRKVTDRPVLKIRESGKIPDNSQLLIIGHPTGLPTKVATGAFVTKNNESTRFSASLDSYQGNSGSAVFNAQTGVVEGILVMGKTDYVPSDARNPNSCLVSNKCDRFAKNCTIPYDGQVVDAGEVVTRTTVIINHLQKALKK